jgi:branched-chain amino acid transport system ATP-binding protein
MLELENVTKYFGGLCAINDVSFSVKENESVGLIGPNGSGKTTLFNLITGVYKCSSGKIAFQGNRIDGTKPYRICHMGVGRTFQITRPFPHMTVRENVAIGAIYGKTVKGISPRLALQKADDVLEFVGLANRKHTLVTNLTLADKKMVELAKAVSTQPKLLLLDEVMAGLNTTEVAELMKTVRKIHDSGATVIIIEHVMKAIVGLASRTIVLNFGNKIADGPTHEVMNEKGVIETYLGKEFKVVRSSRAAS